MVSDDQSDQPLPPVFNCVALGPLFHIDIVEMDDVQGVMIRFLHPVLGWQGYWMSMRSASMLAKALTQLTTVQ